MLRLLPAEFTRRLAAQAAVRPSLTASELGRGAACTLAFDKEEASLFIQVGFVVRSWPCFRLHCPCIGCCVCRVNESSDRDACAECVSRPWCVQSPDGDTIYLLLEIENLEPLGAAALIIEAHSEVVSKNRSHLDTRQFTFQSAADRDRFLGTFSELIFDMVRFCFVLLSVCVLVCILSLSRGVLWHMCIYFSRFT